MVLLLATGDTGRAAAWSGLSLGRFSSALLLRDGAAFKFSCPGAGQTRRCCLLRRYFLPCVMMPD